MKIAVLACSALTYGQNERLELNDHFLVAVVQMRFLLEVGTMSLPSKLTSAFAAFLILVSCGCFGGSNQQDDDSEKSKVLYSDNPTAVQPWFENGDAFSPEKWPDEFLAQIAADRLDAMAESLRSLSLQDSPKPIISNQLQISGWRKSQLKAP